MGVSEKGNICFFEILKGFAPFHMISKFLVESTTTNNISIPIISVDDLLLAGVLLKIAMHRL